MRHAAQPAAQPQCPVHGPHSHMPTQEHQSSLTRDRLVLVQRKEAHAGSHLGPNARQRAQRLGCLCSSGGKGMGWGSLQVVLGEVDMEE